MASWMPGILLVCLLQAVVAHHITGTLDVDTDATLTRDAAVGANFTVAGHTEISGDVHTASLTLHGARLLTDAVPYLSVKCSTSSSPPLYNWATVENTGGFTVPTASGDPNDYFAVPRAGVYGLACDINTGTAGTIAAFQVNTTDISAVRYGQIRVAAGEWAPASFSAFLRLTPADKLYYMTYAVGTTPPSALDANIIECQFVFLFA